MTDSWLLISSAPRDASNVRVMMRDGSIHEEAHWASDLSGEEQPAFQGWFIKGRYGFTEIEEPQYWQLIKGARMTKLLDKIVTPADLEKFHQQCAGRGLELLRRKNHDYAGYSVAGVVDPFKNFRSHQEYGICVRAGDKLKRLENFCQNGGVLKVEDESIQDTAIDLMNYAILFLAYGRSPLSHPAQEMTPVLGHSGRALLCIDNSVHGDSSASPDYYLLDQENSCVLGKIDTPCLATDIVVATIKRAALNAGSYDRFFQPPAKEQFPESPVAHQWMKGDRVRVTIAWLAKCVGDKGTVLGGPVLLENRYWLPILWDNNGDVPSWYQLSKVQLI